MKTWILLALTSLALLVLLAGCGTSTSNSNTMGYGSDAGPWPTAPNRQLPGAAATPTRADEPPKLPLQIVLNAKSAKDEALLLDVSQVDLKTGSQWVPAATHDGIAAIESLPVRATEKGTQALLLNGVIPKAKYTFVRLTLLDKKTVLAHGDTTLTLTLQGGTVSLEKGWTPDDKVKMNLLTITLDGTKVSKDKDNATATLPADALSAQTGQPTGGITGKLTPPTANAYVKAYWGTVELGKAIPDAQTGSFTINTLPGGKYRLELNTPGRKLIEPLKDPIAVENVVVDLKTLALTDVQSGTSL